MSLSGVKALLSAITAERLAIKLLLAVRHHNTASTPRRVTAIEIAKRSNQSACCVEDRMNYLVETVGCDNYISLMGTNLRIFQLNIHKKDVT
jgi:hypothetical protein